MKVTAIGIQRRGGENDPNANVAVRICDDAGCWWTIGIEQLGGAFSHNWNIPDDFVGWSKRFEMDDYHREK